MKLLAVCESPPTLDVRDGNGSTLISAQLLQRLPDDIELDLVWFSDREAGPDPAVLTRAATTLALPVRPAAVSLVAHVATRRTRGCWQRTSRAARSAVASRQQAVDVVYFHGFHTFELAARCGRPFVVHEVDPWSTYWEQRASTRGPLGGAYDRLQARRAARLEVAVAARAATYIVVNHGDADELGRRVRRDVLAVPNGVPQAASAAAADPSRCGVPGRIVLIGSLDYPPNIDAATVLCRTILPRVAAAIPEAHVILAGRRPAPEVLALAGPAVEIRADVPDLASVLADAAIAVFPGSMGRGTKNSLLLALGSGVAVAAVPGAVRGVATAGDDHVLVAGLDGLADAVIELLQDDAARNELAARGAAFAASLPTWDDVATRMSGIFRAAAAGRSPAGAR